MYLYGAGGHAKVIMDILKAEGQVLEGVIDDNENLSELLGYPVLHGVKDISPVIVSIGNNSIRQKIVKQLSGIFGNAVHPSAIVSESAKIGAGSVVMQGTVIQAESEVGKHCIVNTGASIDHECVLEDYVHISPHATLCGNVFVGEGSWIGAGSVVLPGIRIGKWSVIGAGSVVSKNMPDEVLAVGNRCEVIKNIRSLKI